MAPTARPGRAGRTGNDPSSSWFAHRPDLQYRRTRTVVVPHPKKDLPLGTVRSIARRVGWI